MKGVCDMGFFDNYRQRRLELTGRESAATLEHMQDYFQDGANWTQGMYENANGARCLVGAANHVRVSSIDDAKHWLRLAIAEIAPGVARIEDFNDTRSTFAEVAAVIERAKQLAAQSVARAPRAAACACRGNPAAAAASCRRLSAQPESPRGAVAPPPQSGRIGSWIDASERVIRAPVWCRHSSRRLPTKPPRKPAARRMRSANPAPGMALPC